MKTIDLQGIKDNIAASYGYDDWNDLLKMHVKTNHNEGSAAYSRKALVEYENEVAEQYAKQRCDEQIKACAASVEQNGHNGAVTFFIKGDVAKTKNVLDK